MLVFFCDVCATQAKNYLEWAEHLVNIDHQQKAKQSVHRWFPNDVERIVLVNGLKIENANSLEVLRYFVGLPMIVTDYYFDKDNGRCVLEIDTNESAKMFVEADTKYRVKDNHPVLRLQMKSSFTPTEWSDAVLNPMIVAVVQQPPTPSLQQPSTPTLQQPSPTLAVNPLYVGPPYTLNLCPHSEFRKKFQNYFAEYRNNHDFEKRLMSLWWTYYIHLARKHIFHAYKIKNSVAKYTGKTKMALVYHHKGEKITDPDIIKHRKWESLGRIETNSVVETNCITTFRFWILGNEETEKAVDQCRQEVKNPLESEKIVANLRLGPNAVRLPLNESVNFLCVGERKPSHVQVTFVEKTTDANTKAAVEYFMSNFTSFMNRFARNRISFYVTER